MAGKLFILCFVLAMVTIATCKPRNPFEGLFRRGKLVKAETDKSFGYLEHVLFYFDTFWNSNSNWTEWSAIQVVMARVISRSGRV